ncbi:MAG: deoxyribonuclease IV [Chloroflexi bacterium]|nr:deoxyribonuclease IV [Chloroflexota bacterium]
MPLLGAHMSTAGGVSKALERGKAVGCDTIQIFTRNNNRWASKPISPKEVERFQEKVKETGIWPVFSHAAYLINLAGPGEELWEKSIAAFIDELERAEMLGLLGVVVHPGSHMGEGEEAGIERIVAALDRIHEATRGYKPLTLLEITAGTGGHLGYRFEQLAAIRERLREPERVGFCFDTCHAFAAGYDFRTREGYQEVMEEFDEILGLENLKAFHLNDSKHPLGSRKDRHTHIGQGHIGLDGFRWLLNDPRFANVPMVLETPKSKDLHEDVENLAVLRSLIEDAPAE